MLNKKRDLFYLFLLPFICISLNVYALDEFTTTAFKFKSDGLYLNGLISQPTNIEAKSLIIIVHGYGPTNVVKKNSYAEIRSRFTSLGIAVVVWDKPGCGLSEGVFDINQPIESSANEVVAAIKALQHMNAPGIKHVGLWGISRAGWIAPLAINKEPSINFWISVSGTDALENWGYLLKSNLALAGVPQTEVNALYMEWNNGNAIYRTGGSYNDYLQATKLLRQNSLYQRLTGQKYIEYPKGSEEYQKSRAEFVEHQKSFIEEKREFDINTGYKFTFQTLGAF